jgi:hypothetical protein
MTNNIIDLCPCGAIWLPSGSKYNNRGLFLRLDYDGGTVDLSLVHDRDVYVSSGQSFTTSTSPINNLSSLVITKAYIVSKSMNKSLSYSNQFQIIVRSSNKTIAHNTLGSFGDTQNLPSINNEVVYFELPINQDELASIDLSGQKLYVDIYSLCQAEDEGCCDKLPSSLLLSNYSLILTCPSTTTTTTTTTIPPSTTTTSTTTSTTTPSPLGACCEVGVYWDTATNNWIQYRNCLGVLTESECNPMQGFEGARIWKQGQTCSDGCSIPNPCDLDLPDSFIYTVVGFGALSGQEKQVIVNKVGNYWVTQGTFPCGINFTLSMTCDPNTNKFIYDGFLDCGGGTKTVIPPSDIPYIYPNGRSPIIVSYSDVSNCPESCKQCCDWDGDGYIEFPQECFNNRRLNLKFTKINDNIWEANTTTACGDTVQAVVSCDNNIAATDSNSCLQKWKYLYFNISCATNPRITDQVLIPCECQKPPVVKWIADSLDGCQCCCEDFTATMPGTTSNILPLGINVNVNDSVSVSSLGRIFLAADGRFTDAPTKLEIYIGNTLVSVNTNLTDFVSTEAGDLGVSYRDNPHIDNSGQYNLNIKVCPAL